MCTKEGKDNKQKKRDMERNKKGKTNARKSNNRQHIYGCVHRQHTGEYDTRGGKKESSKYLGRGGQLAETFTNQSFQRPRAEPNK